MPRSSPEFEDANAMNVDDEGKSSNDEGSDGEEEYEIEQILKAKRGLFSGSKMAYFVKWKGYGSEENSWVNEDDASNAKELVDEFWRKNAKKGKRQSLGPKRGRKSAAADEESDTSPVARKRGHKSTTKMDSDEDEESAKSKKAKKTSARGRAQEPERVHDMAQYMDESSWEDLVDTIDTVERTPQGLTVYFTLKNGDTVRERGDICRQRFPHKLLDFYESHLKWRTAETNQDD